MKNWLYNKTVIITGASGGIGFNVAKILIEKYDCKIIALARNEQKLLNAKNSLREKSENYIVKAFDVSNKENWSDFLEFLNINNYKPDVLINNAGFMLPFLRFENYSEQEISEIVNTNLLSVVNSTKALLPILKQSETPAIINVASAAGLCPVVGESMYCLTKYAVRGFTETLIEDYRKKIYVAGVYPGFVRTNILNRMSVNDKENNLIQKLMLPVEKASKKIVKGLKRKKTRIVMGIDGRSMSFFSRLFPKLTPRIVSKVLRLSKLDIFEDINK
jgi:short-subunit dehydrogenase